MSMSDCENCWDDVCTCGYKYKHLSPAERREIVNILSDEEHYQSIIQKIKEKLVVYYKKQ